VVPAAVNTVELPVDGIRIVQVGTKEELNLVKALSITFPDFTYPVKVNVESAASHDRCALIAELRTTLVIAPALLTFTKIPSLAPATFFPPKVSELSPKRFTEPSGLRTTAFSALLLVPIKRGFANTPVGVAERRKGRSARTPTSEIPEEFYRER